MLLSLSTSHAWLVLKDSSIHEPSPKYYTIPDEIRTLLKTYGEEVSDKSADISKYEESNLANGTLIDITADQFGQAPIYIGPMDCFHRKFVFDFAHDYNSLEDGRLYSLYNKIMMNRDTQP